MKHSWRNPSSPALQDSSALSQTVLMTSIILNPSQPFFLLSFSFFFPSFFLLFLPGLQILFRHPPCLKAPTSLLQYYYLIGMLRGPFTFWCQRTIPKLLSYQCFIISLIVLLPYLNSLYLMSSNRFSPTLSQSSYPF